MSDVDDEASPQQANDLSQVPLVKLARVYRKMQARVQELTQAYETEVEAIKAQQDQLKTAMKDQMLSSGMKSVNTEAGTVVLSNSTTDWDSFKEFIKQHDAIDLLEKRIAQKNMSMFLEENPGVLPEGLNSFTEYNISVRKPTK
jgi:DNA-binding ferritin-like protein (Dps family)